MVKNTVWSSAGCWSVSIAASRSVFIELVRHHSALGCVVRDARSYEIFRPKTMMIQIAGSRCYHSAQCLAVDQIVAIGPYPSAVRNTSSSAARRNGLVR
jgi:hypothetical protein